MRTKKWLALLLALAMLTASFAIGEGVSADVEAAPAEASGTELDGLALGSDGLMTEAEAQEPEPTPVPEAEDAPLPDLPPEDDLEAEAMLVENETGDAAPVPRSLSLKISKNDSFEMNNCDVLALSVLDGTLVSCTSGNKKVVEDISIKDGVATIVPAAAGTARLTVKDNAKNKYTVSLTVKDPYLPTDVSFKNTLPLGIPVGATLELAEYVSLVPSYAKTSLSWSSSKSSYAKVEKNGHLTAVKPGKTTLTVTTANNKKKTVDLEVLANKATNLCPKPGAADIKRMDSGWTLWPFSVEMESSGALECQFYLINGTSQKATKIENLKLSLALGSRENVVARHTFASQKVSVSKNSASLVTLTLPASAIISRGFFLPDYKNNIYFDLELNSSFRLITKNSRVAYIPDVFPTDFPMIPVERVEMSASELILQKGNSVTLQANILPLNATIPNIVWTTSNAGIVTVEDGVVKAKGVGKAVITASTKDGSGASASCTIEVVKKLVKIKSIALAPKSFNLPSTVSKALTVTINPDNATVTALDWSSSAPGVATVRDGVVTGLTQGSATITATARDGSGKVAQCLVTVTAPPVYVTSLTLDRTQATVEYGKTLTLVPTVDPRNATIQTLAWSSSDPSVATVSNAGVVTGVKTGRATITAATEDGSNLTASCVVEVPVVKVESVALDKSKATLEIGKNLTLKPTVLPALAADQTVTWSTSDGNIASVTSAGVVTAVAAGTATITATAHDGSGKSAACVITVPAVKVKSVSMSKSKATVEIGSTLALTATVKPANASNKALDWTTSKSEVATVSSDGVVTAVSAGTATITATAKDGSGKKAKCTITVPKVKVASIGLNKTEATLVIGETLALAATVLPDNASDKSLTWSTSKSKVASVSSSGVVTANAVGTATITATAKDGSKKTAKCVITVSTVKVASVTLNKTEDTLEVGGKLTLIATVLPENAPDKAITWSSDDPKVASVKDGVVTGVANGTTIITATAHDGSGARATCTVTVGKAPVPVESVSLDKTNETLNVGSTLTLTATVLPADASDKSVTWSTSKSNVATVSTNGVVTGVGAGTATITATAQGGLTASCTVTVVVPVTGITLNESALTLYPSDTLTLTPTVAPTNATDKAIVWTTSDAAVATVSDAGVITAAGIGAATITATAHDGSGVTATCEVTVVDSSTVGDFTVSNCVITGYTGKGGAIAIPDKDAKGNAITAIGEGAFKDNAAITSVAISANVTEIRASAFEGCTALEKVTLPNGVTTIGKAAFKDCAKLSNMTPY